MLLLLFQALVTAQHWDHKRLRIVDLKGQSTILFYRTFQFNSVCVMVSLQVAGACFFRFECWKHVFSRLFKRRTCKQLREIHDSFRSLPWFPSAIKWDVCGHMAPTNIYIRCPSRVQHTHKTSCFHTRILYHVLEIGCLGYCRGFW